MLNEQPKPMLAVMFLVYFLSSVSLIGFVAYCLFFTDTGAAFALLVSKFDDETQTVYVAPEVVLISNDNQTVNFAELLEADQPVMLNFIFTFLVCGAGRHCS
jgi:hypothetical protein